MVRILILILDSIVDRVHDDSVGEALDTVRGIVRVGRVDGGAAIATRVDRLLAAVDVLTMAITTSQLRGVLVLARRGEPKPCGHLASQPATCCVAAAVENATLPCRVLQFKWFRDDNPAET